MFGINNSQIVAAIERLIIIALGYLVGRGWLAPEDVETVTAAVIAIASAGFAIMNNRKSRIADRAAREGMIVLVDPKTANKSKATTVISTENAMVVAKDPRRAL